MQKRAENCRHVVLRFFSDKMGSHENIVGIARICYTFVRKKNEKEVPYEFFVVFN